MNLVIARYKESPQVIVSDRILTTKLRVLLLTRLAKARLHGALYLSLLLAKISDAAQVSGKCKRTQPTSIHTLLRETQAQTILL